MLDNIKEKISERFSKSKKDDENEIVNMTDDFQQEQETGEENSLILDDKTQKQIENNPVDVDGLEVMPSANEQERDTGNSKKMKMALGAVAGTVIVLGGIGLAMGKAEKARQAEKVAEAQAIAESQKQMATGSNIDLVSEQEEIKNSDFQTLPPPSNAPLAGSQGTATVEPPPFPDVKASNAYAPVPYPEPEPVKISEMPTTVKFEENYQPKPVEPVQPPTGFGFGFGQQNTVHDGEQTAPAPVVIEEPPPPKGSLGNVLAHTGTAKVRAVDEPARDEKGMPQQASGKLAGTLTPTVFADGYAGKRANPSYLLPKGTTVPCVLTTRIDSTYQGFTICQVSKDVYSSDGLTLLIERGSKVFGEQNIQITQGKARVQVLWTRIDTPKNVSINIDSPAVGQLGDMGIGAKVNNHYMKRFGGALLLSVIQDGLAVAFENLKKEKGGNTGNSTSTTVNNTEDTSKSMADQLLENTINIPPTAKVNQGTVINIMVARDVDFSTVYKVTKR